MQRIAWSYRLPNTGAVIRSCSRFDDGLATSATMIAALHAARAKEPKGLVCAVPVAAPDSLERVRPYADEVVCIEAPPGFHAVAQFYSEFRQVEDVEVVELLAKTPTAPAALAGEPRSGGKGAN